MNRLIFIVVFFVLIIRAASANSQEADRNSVVRLRIEDANLGPPAKYGIERLRKVLESRGCRIDVAADSQKTLIVGTYGGSKQVKAWVDGDSSRRIHLEKRPEALVVKRMAAPEPSLVVAGYDDVGLMYALLEIADMVEYSTDPAGWFDDVSEVSESSRNGMRRMRVLMHHAANEKDWYHNQEYWDWYIGMLAANRFNGLNLVYSHQTPFMAPMYAWHLKIDEFPDVRPIGVPDEDREKNLQVMRHIAKLCHDRGIELTIGVWQHLPWMNSYLKTRPNQQVMVEGLSGENIGRYTYLAVKSLLKECPGIARIQIRPNDESGIHLSEQTAFYRDNVMRAIREAAPHVKLDLRTVGVQPATIEAARQADLSVRTSIKFCGEFLGMPFTPREVCTVGYSYKDYLQKPMPNPVYNEVWMLGSHRILLWGSESYGREFGRNASYGGTIGFETDGPLAQKGYQKADGPAWRIFLNPDDEYYTHEIERYWAFFRTIGRFTYNPDTPHEVWMRPFRKRFAAAADAMAQAYESASRVIGLIVTSHVEDTNMYVWPEISMGGVISAYIDQRGLDKGLFPSIRDQVDDELAGRLTGRNGPYGLAAIYEQVASHTDQALGNAAMATQSPSPEYRATVNDFQILTHLARYHAHRQREGYQMAKFYRTSDAGLLPSALAESEAAVDEWNKLTAIGRQQYCAEMQTGPRENGHWQDKLRSVAANPQIIREAAETLKSYGVFDLGFDFGRPALTGTKKIFEFFNYSNDYFHERRFIGIDPSVAFDPRIGYGFTENDGLKWKRNPMVLHDMLSGVEPVRDSPLPLDLLGSDFVHSKKRFNFRMDFPKMDAYWFTFVFSDRSEKPRDHGPFNLEWAGSRRSGAIAPKLSVSAGETVTRQFRQDIRRSWDPFWIFSLVPSEAGADAMISALTVHRDAPNLAHASPLRVPAGEACVLSATITMPPRPTGVKGSFSAAPDERLARAAVHFRTSSSEPFREVPLESQDGFVFSATIPPDQLLGNDLEYYFTAVDANGRTTSMPDEPDVHPYRARVTSDAAPPTIAHEPITHCIAGESLVIRAHVNDADGVAAVRVYYRTMNQTLPYERITMERINDEYVATIPAEAVRPDWDFVYYLEAVDQSGNGCFFPEWTKTAPYVIVRTEPQVSVSRM